MKPILLLLLIVLGVSSVRGETLRIATYNLNFANTRGDEVLAAIAAADADVICLQETTTQSEQFLRSRLANTHPHFHAAGHLGKYYAERFAFASKVELRKVEFAPPTAGLFGFYLAEAVLAGGAVRVVNVHLTPVTSTTAAGISQWATLLSVAEEKHGREIAAIVARLDPTLPTIVLGDFNSISSFVAPKRLAELGMIDAFASLHADADSHPTWTWPTRPIPLVLRIDYIFHTSHFRATRSQVLRRQGSDHALLYAVLDRRDGRDPLK